MESTLVKRLEVKMTQTLQSIQSKFNAIIAHIAAKQCLCYLNAYREIDGTFGPFSKLFCCYLYKA